jgi:hypothetical protein
LEFLRDGSPSEILARLVEGDPFAIGALSQRACAERGLLLNRDRLALRGMSRIAFEARRRDPEIGLDAWIGECVARSARELVEEQLDEERGRGRLEDSPDGDYYHALGAHLGIEPELARTTCARINGLAERERRVFHALVIERVSPEECARRGLGSEDAVLESFRSAILSVTRLFDQMSGNDSPWKGWL